MLKQKRCWAVFAISVSSWEGGQNHLDQDLSWEKKHDKKNWVDEYEEELDRGKVGTIFAHYTFYVLDGVKLLGVICILNFIVTNSVPYRDEKKVHFTKTPSYVKCNFRHCFKLHRWKKWSAIWRMHMVLAPICSRNTRMIGMQTMNWWVVPLRISTSCFNSCFSIAHYIFCLWAEQVVQWKTFHKMLTV